MVGRILDQSGKPRDTRIVVGYLAAPDDQGPIRIYLDLTFRAYFEVRRDTILYVQKPDPSDETRPTKILVEVKEPLQLVQAVEASFLRGHITATHPIVTPAMFGPPTGGQVPVCTQPPPPGRTRLAPNGGGVVQTQCPMSDGEKDL
jgi:hypothetical protein